MSALLKELEELNAPAAAVPDIEDSQFDNQVKKKKSKRIFTASDDEEEEDKVETVGRRQFTNALDLRGPRYTGERVGRAELFGDSTEMNGLSAAKREKKRLLSGGSEGEEEEDDDSDADDEQEENENDDDRDAEDSEGESGEGESDEEGEKKEDDEEEDKVTMAQLTAPAPSASEEQKKAESVRKQIALCEQVLLLNIKSHGAMRACNQLPRGELARALHANADDSTRANLAQAQKNAQRLVAVLLEVERCMLEGSSQTRGILEKDNKEGSNGELDSEDEEIESSEDEEDGEDKKGKKANGKVGGEGGKGGKKKKEEEDEEEDMEEDDDGSIPDYNVEGSDASSDADEENAGVGNGQKKLPSLLTLRKRCVQAEVRFEQFRTNTLQKWDARTRLVTATHKKKKEGGQGDFSAFEGDVISQIEKILSDQRRLIARTQVKRSDNERIGGDPEATHDPEIFDDDDFYQVLLRDLIERKSNGETMDSVAMSRQWLELEKLRARRSKKKKVDTKASKGRKIRYTVLPKLVNFHAATPERVAWTHEMRNQLCKSLFR